MKKLAVVVALSAGALLGAHSAVWATVLVEDFTYSPDNAVLAGQTGGSGWGNAWARGFSAGNYTSRILTHNSGNLSYSGGGYNIAQTGNGYAYGNFNAFRGINRDPTTPLTGTVWFSVLLDNPLSTNHAGIEFDYPGSNTQDYNQGPWDVELSGTSLIARYNSVNTTVGPALTLNQAHLILGRITFQDNGSNDKLDVWADPLNLGNLGAPLFTANTADMGLNFFRVGIFGYGPVDPSNGGFVDALRVSDGGGDAGRAFFEVTGVIPEPSTLMLLGLGLGGLVLKVRRRATQAKRDQFSQRTGP